MSRNVLVRSVVVAASFVLTGLAAGPEKEARADQPSETSLEPLPAPPEPAPSSDVGAPAQADAAAPVATVPPAPSAIARSDKDPAKEMRPSFRAAAGFQYAQVHGIPITGARMRFAGGGQTDFGGHYAVLSILYGSTENDLRTWDVRAGWIGDFLRFSVLRLGLDAELGYLVIRRASIDDRLWALGIGAGAHASADLFSFGPRGDHAILAELRIDAHVHFGGAFMWGPSLLLGFRY